MGGTSAKPHRGVVLRLVSAPPSTTDADLAAAIDEARAAPDRWDQRGDESPEATLPRAERIKSADARPSEREPPETAAWPWVAIVAGTAAGLGTLAYLYLGLGADAPCPEFAGRPAGSGWFSG